MGISNMEDTPWKAWKMNPRINPRSTDEMVSNKNKGQNKFSRNLSPTFTIVSSLAGSCELLQVEPD